MSRRGRVYRDGERWAFIVDTAPDGAPRKQMRRRGFETKKAATSALTKVVAGVDDGSFVEPSKLTVADWLDRWTATQAVVGRSPTTLAGYERDIRNHVAPAIGAARLQALTAADVDRLYSTMVAK